MAFVETNIPQPDLVRFVSNDFPGVRAYLAAPDAVVVEFEPGEAPPGFFFVRVPVSQLTAVIEALQAIQTL